MTAPEQVQLQNIADCDHEIFALIKQRYSPRTFKQLDLKEGHVKQLFEAARWSASCFNWQPWRFIYAHKNTEAYDKIVSCLSDFNKEWAINAPVLMLTAYKEKTDEGEDNFHALHDLGLALGGMTTQAQYLGIAMHHMAGLDWKKAQKIFEVPQGFHITTCIAMGYYGGDIEELSTELQLQELKERERMPQEEFAFKEKWSNES